jgi:MFS family permease
LLLPALASRFGFASAYTVLALACAITALFAWRWLHEPTHTRADDGHPDRPAHNAVGAPGAPGTQAKASPLRDLRIWRVALAAGALCVPQLAVVTFGTVFLHDFGHAGVLAISVTLAAVQTGAAIARVWSGSWTDRRGNRRAYMRACSLLTAVLFAALALATGLAGTHHAALTAVFALMVVLGGVSASAWHGVAFTELATLAGTNRAGTALAIGNTCVFLTLFLTPLAIPPLLSVGSWPMVWAVASACALLAWPVFPRAPLQRKARVAGVCDAA